MAKGKMVDLNNIWKDRGIPTKLKITLLKSLIWPVMMYGCEAWTLRADELSKINAAELWFYRRLLRVSWKDRRTNESILSDLNVIDRGKAQVQFSSSCLLLSIRLLWSLVIR